jgi:ParB family chromosome partitioning protein
MNPKRNALGKGLSALLQNAGTDITTKSSEQESATAGSIAQLSIEQIEANPFQPRTYFEEDALNELAESIKEMGLIQPVTVRKLGYDKYQLISGERRFRASQLAGLTHIPAYIRIANDKAMLEMALVENIQREELDAIEIALAYQRLIEEVKLTQEEVSEKVSKKRSTVTNYLRLLKLPPEVQLAIRKRVISMGHARALVNIEDPQRQLELLERILTDSLSVREIEEAVRDSKTSAATKPKAKIETALPDALRKQLSDLYAQLKMDLEVKHQGKGKGQIHIRFKNETELKKILDKLAS